MHGTKATLRVGPEGAPNFCFGLYDETGECLCFVQTDWEYPSLAQSLGWTLMACQKPDRSEPCEHDATDGTVPCYQCGLIATDFISAAYDWLAERDGHEFEVHDYAVRR